MASWVLLSPPRSHRTSPSPYGLTASNCGGCLRAAASTGGSPYGLALAASNRPLVGDLGYSRLPLQPAWPWVAAPARGLAMAGHPYKGSGRGQPPLQVACSAAPSSLRLLQKCSKNA
ncbi:hypothetical protein GW17_00031181 [Ensete ventricosum]|nr:hypothetical protein GW17_00031181 [Ensete ventricosum]